MFAVPRPPGDDLFSEVDAIGPAISGGRPVDPPIDTPVAPPLAELNEPVTPPSSVALLLAPPTEAPPRTWRDYFTSLNFRQRLSSFAASLTIHLSILLLLSLAFFATREQPLFPTSLITLRPVTAEEPLTMVDLSEPTYTLPGEVTPEFQEALDDALLPELPDINAPLASEPEPTADSQLTPTDGTLRAAETLPRLADSGGGLAGRSDEFRAALVGKHGGTPASEEAVAKGLRWLAAHQNNNGSWHFDHRSAVCDGLCQNPGTATTTTGATAIALLPFLGAGHTHLTGEHREVVKRGLYYLQSRMRSAPQGGDFMEGTMYAQGLTAIALSEAYAMTKDKDLRPHAQQAIDYICYAQHPAGGWRYFPGQPGDTTVFGWQLMALKSAALANLEVPSPVIERAARYLDSVQTEQGAYYGYLKAAKEPTPTSVGLLARMYLGWPRKQPQLKTGTDYLARLGPSPEDMYFNYYTTQVLHHYGGPQWDQWNQQMRDYLVESQVRHGHEHGSWFFPDEHALAGGRLYTTAMCVMILEVYYRHLPLYGARSIDEGF